MTEAPAKPKKKAKRGPLKNFWKAQWLLPLIADTFAWVVLGAMNSWRVTSTQCPPNTQELLDQRAPVIFAIWHGRMNGLLKAVPKEHTAVLVSPSNDGEFITRIARRLGFRHFVRGSAKRDGLHAVLGLHKALNEEKHAVAFTVDGPRGPRYKVKPGIIRLASQTGAPIVPIGSTTPFLLAKFEKAWDHYHAPFFFSRMCLRYGPPLHVPKDADEATLARYAQELEDELMRLNLEADAHFGLKDRL